MEIAVHHRVVRVARAASLVEPLVAEVCFFIEYILFRECSLTNVQITSCRDILSQTIDICVKARVSAMHQLDYGRPDYFVFFKPDWIHQ